MTEYVILVDENDIKTGLAEKMQAHQQNLLHRAFSVFIFQEKTEKVLLQQRGLQKYHCPGLWTNTCCSHPRDGESVLEAGKRRLKEELGITAELKDLGWFKYNAHFDNGLSEHEIDHVLVGTIAENALIKLNPEEVNATRWISMEELREELQAHPENFTPWLLPALDIATAL